MGAASVKDFYSPRRLNDVTTQKTTIWMSA